MRAHPLVLFALALASTVPCQAESESKDRRRREVVLRLAELIEEHYVEADVGRQLAEQLTHRLERGDYDEWDSPHDLAAALTRELQAQDRHFAVSWSPPDALNAVAGTHSDESRSRWLAYSRTQNFGFTKVEILPGNVGYLDLRYFDDPELAASAGIAAMQLLAHSDAVIVDLRRNGGGEPQMVQLLISYFLGPDRVHYNSLYWRNGDQTHQYWTLPHLPGRRILDVPLFVLTSAQTGSAAEEFTYALQTRKRATIVGEVTAGAANPGEGFVINNGFSTFISTGKAINPVTGTNWEKAGIRPDIEVPSVEGLERAHALALRGLIESSTSGRERTDLQWAIEAVEARSNPVLLSNSELEEYVGVYGDRQIRLAGNYLTYQRGRRSVCQMVPLDNDRFLLTALDGFRLRFERNEDGRISRLVDMWSDGHEESNLRR